MSTKEEKPTLAGVNVKTRKRNIVIPEDPASFADAVVTIIQNAAAKVDSKNVEAILEASAKALDSAELEWNRYGDTLFEVFFAGGRLGAGTSLADETAKKLDFCILSTGATPAEAPSVETDKVSEEKGEAPAVAASASVRELMTPYFNLFQSLTRRRPFLVRNLENTLTKLSLSLEFLDRSGREKLGIALALTFSMKIIALPENIFSALLNDRLVQKGSVLEVLCVFFREFLRHDSLEDLVSILTKARVVNRLPDFAPPSIRNQEEFYTHLEENGLKALVDYDKQRGTDMKVSELQEALTELIVSDPPTSPADVLAAAQSKKTESGIPDTDVLIVIWNALLSSVNLTGKNQQQIVQSFLQKFKTHHKLLATFATSTKSELSLINAIQVACYEDSRLLKIFTELLKILYNAEIVGEDTIQLWYKKGSNAKGRAVFLKDVEPFIKWLNEAESDEEEED
uniref:W2 domain-containing protein n=1 Tax=Polytomella parva TaxID=51329 RepID=A0A7S0V4U6_9CHLO|mmetsp:Transcript_30564/g.55718  ORF Transcript_30564/g.55718 Transcript_30564/m.55718 type:complete len:456 (+) Transcript_30564:108-1475(+)|eukprot:CAMPEP_0175049692 /NCGR_PEP_ID=MMETSP0052_2-20121109/6863_1 /TAXON_ID=51329 ORGANISM="Polytomella parva, Strain SAG 63-3" /NCGR_SAMPLE_ID=MMETSP0052_2 /ASSEMBLY_ACC=CAM_ASM_000194 /LENGTH=455 /DNA_ID=CAMNT_0016313849 /DNA_START=106 /DNA_END=1473 /DNA_ORIENTATION=-